MQHIVKYVDQENRRGGAEPEMLGPEQSGKVFDVDMGDSCNLNKKKREKTMKQVLGKIKTGLRFLLRCSAVFILIVLYGGLALYLLSVYGFVSPVVGAYSFLAFAVAAISVLIVISDLPFRWWLVPEEISRDQTVAN